MKMFRPPSSLVLTLLAVSPAAQTSLFGITASANGESDLVQIDTLTGAATKVLSLDVPVNWTPHMLAFHDPSAQFLVQLLLVGTSGLSTSHWQFGVLDPLSGSLSVSPYTGFPSDSNVEGLAYDPIEDRVLLTTELSGDGDSIRLSEVNLVGGHLQTSSALPISDRDYAAFNPQTGEILLGDFNGNGGLPAVLSVSDPFGAPITSAIASPPLATWARELAVDESGRIFTTHFSQNELVELVASSFTTIGSFSYPEVIRGIAFGSLPEAPSAESVRLGLPPNPNAFLPGVTSGPTIGETWDPVIDHTSFVTGATTDFALIGGGPLNLPLGPQGTLLCNPAAAPFLLVSAPAPGAPFAIPVPNNFALVGLSLCAQGASFDSGIASHLANALDITIGTF